MRKNSGTEKEAEDVFQDAMIATYQKASDEEFALSCKLSTFIFGVAKNIWLDRLRSRGRYVYTEAQQMEEISPPDGQNLDQVVIEAEMDMVYRRNFARLSSECQKILTYFFNGYSMKEIVKKLKFPSDAFARKKKFNCKNELVKLVEADSYYHELVVK